ncbi:MAG: poly-gamma-glutamate synthase PgsB [Phycisphaerae bacterium]|nr:poly-gamma-glutamate synthase PgsB [Phycisphaerae bacterium]
MTGTWLVLGTVVLLVAIGLIEGLLHRRNLRRIPIRIHVNGTRGKSSVARLIAAGLREGGIRTCAKTTGTLPRMILPDGFEYPIFRPARANVIEQVRILDRAADSGVEALVIECMALLPRLQWISESRLVRSTHGVITNARADHLDVMGPTERDVALALAGSTPLGGTLFTAEQRHREIFEHTAEDRGSRLVCVNEKDFAAVTDEELAGFSYVEHRENIALALRVCQELGVERQTALRGMWAATPDPGVMKVYQVEFFGRRIIFINGFAANDPESTERIWNIALEHFPQVDRRVALFNCRADRPDRSWQLGEVCPSWRPADNYVLMGTGTFIFARAAAAGGLDLMKITFVENQEVHRIFETLVGLGGKSMLVMGMGNIGGQGLEMVQYFQNRSMMQEAI